MTDDDVGPDPGPFELADIVDGQPVQPIPVAAVVRQFAWPILDRQVVSPREHVPRADVEVTVDIGQLLRLGARLLAPAVALAIAVLVVWGLSWALLIGAMGSIARVLGWLASRAAFSFGDGFLAFRQDRSWPRGVQEEYDVTWVWPKATR
jgi:hypothetical protein